MATTLERSTSSSTTVRENLDILDRLKAKLKTDKDAVHRVLVDAHIVTKGGKLTSAYSGRR